MKNFKRIAIIGGLALAGVATAGALRAFPNVENWADDPSQGIHDGNGGLWATGGVKDWGITCTMCHINDVNQQGNISATVSFNPPLNAGQYHPTQAYVVTVNLLGEHLGTANAQEIANNKNGMTATFEDPNGVALGTLLGDSQVSCPPAAPTLPDPALGATYTWAYGDCHAVAGLGVQGPPGMPPNVSLTKWNFKWKAPAAGKGTATMFYGVVDGNSDKKSLGDDVKMGKQVIAEGP